MTKRLFERELQWGNATRALQFFAILLGMQLLLALMLAWHMPMPRRWLRLVELSLLMVTAGRAWQLITGGNTRERWVGILAVLCSGGLILSMFWLTSSTE